MRRSPPYAPCVNEHLPHRNGRKRSCHDSTSSACSLPISTAAEHRFDDLEHVHSGQTNQQIARAQSPTSQGFSGSGRCSRAPNSQDPCYVPGTQITHLHPAHPRGTCRDCNGKCDAYKPGSPSSPSLRPSLEGGSPKWLKWLRHSQNNTRRRQRSKREKSPIKRTHPTLPAVPAHRLLC